MKRFFCVVILLFFLLFMYAKYVEPQTIGVYEYLVSSEKIPQSFNGIKIAHFSDLLYESTKNDTLVQKVIDEINESQADVIVFTGDLIKGKITDEKKEQITKLLTKLNARLYKYAILGDRDSKKAQEILEESGFIILNNTSTYLFNEGNTPILIAGGDNLTNEILPVDEEIAYSYKIGLIHKPDDFDSIKNDYNLVLAGHSLGGQIRIPYIGATIKKSGAQKYTDKTYSEKDNYLFVSFGIGNDKPYLRLFNKPSINIYRLYNK